MTLKAAFHTLGCKTNHYETDAIAKRFTDAGFERVDFDAIADVYIINTCTVTGEADRKSRQMLRRAKRQAPGSVVVAMGCHAELSDASAYADIVIGTQGKSHALERVRSFLNAREDPLAASGHPIRTSNPTHAARAAIAANSANVTHTAHASHAAILHEPNSEWTFEDLGIVDRQSECRAQIKIEDGCNSFCAYCAIPFARGRIRSRAEELILAEAKALAQAGYREVVLTGIHVCSYGQDRGESSEAVMVLANKISAIEGIERIRLGSLEPLSITQAFITQARLNPKLCPHFHLSLQSGSDTVLERMNRRYSTEQFRAVAAALRAAFPGCSLTTDIIVAFPGESDAEFAQTLAFCSQIGFARMHIFRYSPRQGTLAAAMKNQIASGVSADRSQRLQALANTLSEAFHRSSLDQPQYVLVETLREDGSAEGYTSAYVPVCIKPGEQLDTNRIYQVRPTHADHDFLYATDAKPCGSC